MEDNQESEFLILMARGFYLVLFSVLLCFACNPEMEDQPELTGSVNGTIFNEFDQHVRGFEVFIKSGSDDVLPDTVTQSSFNFNELRVGSYILVAKAENYITAIEEISVQKDQSTNVEIILEAGEETLTISDSTLYISAPSDSNDIGLESNSSWIIKSKNEWLGVSTGEGGGDGLVRIKWKENPLDEIRVGEINVYVGDLTKAITVIQDYDPTLLTTKGIPGNHVTQIPDSVSLKFNKDIKIH